MSHTKEFQVPGYGLVVLNHNQDWTGMVDIAWREGENVRSTSIPAKLFLLITPAIALTTFKSDLVSFIDLWGNSGISVPPAPAPDPPPEPEAPPEQETGEPTKEGDGK